MGSNDTVDPCAMTESVGGRVQNSNTSVEWILDIKVNVAWPKNMVIIQLLGSPRTSTELPLDELLAQGQSASSFELINNYLLVVVGHSVPF